MSDVVSVPVMETMKGQGGPEVACTQIPCELHARWKRKRNCQ